MERRCYLVQKLRYKTSDLAAAILDFRLPVTSDSIRHSVIELLYLENVGVAFGTALLSSIAADI